MRKTEEQFDQLVSHLINIFKTNTGVPLPLKTLMEMTGHTKKHDERKIRSAISFIVLEGILPVIPSRVGGYLIAPSKDDIQREISTCWRQIREIMKRVEALSVFQLGLTGDGWEQNVKLVVTALKTLPDSSGVNIEDLATLSGLSRAQCEEILGEMIDLGLVIRNCVVTTEDDAA